MSPQTPTGTMTSADRDDGPRIGRYEIKERVGVGGMAEVFRAVARGPGRYQRELIIKRILPHLAEEPEFVRAFIDEGKILGLLNHRNIVGVYDFGEDAGRHYLALEYLDGPSLGTIMSRAKERNEPMAPGLVAYLGREVCHGLQAVHTLCDPFGHPMNVIHRDVTPSNVMTTRQGAVKLLDFGVAKITDAAPVTQHGQIKGKAGYFAPEQIKGGAIDGRVDLFALGVMLYEALTLEHLFYGEGGPMGAIYRVMEMEIQPLSERRPDAPTALTDAVMRALERNPERRYQSAAEMASVLDDVLLTARAGPTDLATYVQTRWP
ncbi:MAG TPA: serine/threonine-protein kinase [Polyangia bacterium]